ncbi:hypothetical protein BJ508DRAFT_332917 [Ascobolus immersus RN42]|nr:hypothetical protein BJ508DRAFT_335143 [Ascobolus immersus RN42]RPA74628.1 hypothetical protein BJ508DRAFT_332917 [Ascobolus immersus RN42]
MSGALPRAQDVSRPQSALNMQPQRRDPLTGNMVHAMENGTVGYGRSGPEGHDDDMPYAAASGYYSDHGYGSPIRTTERDRDRGYKHDGGGQYDYESDLDEETPIYGSGVSNSSRYPRHGQSGRSAMSKRPRVDEYEFRQNEYNHPDDEDHGHGGYYSNESDFEQHVDNRQRPRSRSTSGPSHGYQGSTSHGHDGHADRLYGDVYHDREHDNELDRPHVGGYRTDEYGRKGAEGYHPYSHGHGQEDSLRPNDSVVYYKGGLGDRYNGEMSRERMGPANQLISRPTGHSDQRRWQEEQSSTSHRRSSNESGPVPYGKIRLGAPVTSDISHGNDASSRGRGCVQVYTQPPRVPLPPNHGQARRSRSREHEHRHQRTLQYSQNGAQTNHADRGNTSNQLSNRGYEAPSARDRRFVGMYPRPTVAARDARTMSPSSPMPGDYNLPHMRSPKRVPTRMEQQTAKYNIQFPTSLQTLSSDTSWRPTQTQTRYGRNVAVPEGAV